MNRKGGCKREIQRKNVAGEAQWEQRISSVKSPWIISVQTAAVIYKTIQHRCTARRKLQ